MIKQTRWWVAALAVQGLMTAGVVQAKPASSWAAELAGDRLGWAQEPPGVAVTMGGPASTVKPLKPNEVKSAGLLFWLDAADMDGDGVVDADPPRRRAVMGWKGKAKDVNFPDMIL